MIWIIFIMLSVGLLSSGTMVIYQKSPVHSALFLILAFLFLAGFYLMLGAEFIAFVHVVVYAGAIMVLFLFVIMLLNLKRDVNGFVGGQVKIFIALFSGGLVCLLLLVMVSSGPAYHIPDGSDQIRLSDSDYCASSIESIGILLYSRYLLPFELASILLIVAMIGAVVLAKRSIRTSEVSAGGPV